RTTSAIYTLSLHDALPIYNGGVARGEKEETKDDADDDGEDVAESRPERATYKHLAHVAQHVVAHAFSTGRVDITASDLQSVQSIDRKSTRLNSSHVAISYA